MSHSRRLLTALLAALLCPALLPAVEILDDHGPVADFSLKDQTGSTLTRDDLLGKVWIASFVMVNCPDGKCPQVTSTVQRLQKELQGRGNLRFVTFTVDPIPDDSEKRASLEKARKSMPEKFGADPERWFFLTGKEETIDGLLRSFMLRKRDGKFEKGQIDHSQKLVLVDRKGHIRGYFDGLDDPNMPEGAFEANLRRLKRSTDTLRMPDLPAYLPRDFPAFNAALNALAATLLLLGWMAIRLRLVRLHAAFMLTTIAVSAVFLTSYLFYHIVIKEGRATSFAEQAPGAPAWVRYLYLAILVSHTILAIFATPMALYTAWQGLRNNIQKHVRIARWTLPIWMYVSITGVVVYWMLYRLYADG